MQLLIYISHESANPYNNSICLFSKQTSSQVHYLLVKYKNPYINPIKKVKACNENNSDFQHQHLDLSYGDIRMELASGVLICAMLFKLTGDP